MPFRSSKVQSRLMDPEIPDDLSTPNKLFTFLTSSLSSNSTTAFNSPPLVFLKSIPPRTLTSWWRPLTPVVEDDVGVEEPRGPSSFAVEDGPLVQDMGGRESLQTGNRVVVHMEYGGNLGRAHGRGARWKRCWAVLEMVVLFSLVGFLVGAVIWAVINMGHRKVMASRYHSPELRQR